MELFHFQKSLMSYSVFQAATMRHKVSPGCGAFAEESEDEEAKERKASDPCDRKPCRHGECSAKSTHPGFQCECQPGFAGKLCDIRGGFDLGLTFIRNISFLYP